MEDDSPKGEGVTCLKMARVLKVETPTMVTSQKRPAQVATVYKTAMQLGVASFHVLPLHKRWFLGRACQLVERNRKVNGTWSSVKSVHDTLGLTHKLRRDIASTMKAEEDKVRCSITPRATENLHEIPMQLQLTLCQW